LIIYLLFRLSKEPNISQKPLDSSPHKNGCLTIQKVYS